MPDIMNDRATSELNRARALLKGAVPSGNIFEATVERLGQSVKLGLFAPGQQLPTERELAELIGVSRTTVRSAIQVLVNGGFLVVRRGRSGGTFVSERLPPRKRGRRAALLARPTEEVKELLDRRFVLECGIAELAAERATEDQITILQDLAQRMLGKLDDLEAYRRIDGQFHIAIAQATDSASLTAAMAEMQANLSDLIALIPRSEEALKHSNEQHTRIVRAISRHDAAAARKYMKQHLEGTTRFLRGILPNE